MTYYGNKVDAYCVTGDKFCASSNITWGSLDISMDIHGLVYPPTAVAPLSKFVLERILQDN